MKTRIRQAAAVLLAALLVMAIPAGLGINTLPVGEAAAANTTIDDFEDGQADDDWTTSMNISSTVVADGSFAGSLTAGATTKSAERSFTGGSYSNISIKFRTTGFGSDKFKPSIMLQSGSSDIVTDLNINQSGNVTVYDGTYHVTDLQLETGSYYTIRFEEIDYGANTYNVSVYDGSTKLGEAGPFSFRTATSSVDYLTVDAAPSQTTYYDTIEADVKPPGAGGGPSDLSGHVEACPVSNPNCDNPTALDNATVEIYAVDRSQITAKKGQTKIERGKELLRQARQWNLSDLGWEPGFNPAQNMSTRDTKIVLAHRPDQWERENIFMARTHSGTVGFQADPTLGNPVLRVPSGEPVILSLWNPHEEGLVENGVDADINPGVLTYGTVVVEELSMTGEVTQRLNKTTLAQFETGVPQKDISYARLNLNDGFYRVYPESEGRAAGYVIAVGDPQGMAEMFRKDLRDRAGDRVQRGKDLVDKLSQNKFTRVTITANETRTRNGEVVEGWFSHNFSDSNLVVVGVQAYRMDGTELPTVSNPSPDDMVDRVQATDYNGSVYFGPAKTYDVPSRNITVETVEVPRPKFGNISDIQAWWEWFRGQLGNESYLGLAAALQNPPDEFVRDEFEQTRNQTADVVCSDTQAAQRYEELTGRECDQILNTNPGDLTNQDLRDQLQNLTEVLENTTNSVPTNPPQTSTGENTVTSVFGFGANLQEDAVSVIAHWPNGTSTAIAPASEGGYWRVENNVGGDDVVISEFPLGETDPAAVEFEVTVAGSDLAGTPTDESGIGNAREGVRNPTFGERMPGLSSIAFNTLRPGPSDQVRLTVHAADQSTFRQITSATVWGPDGFKRNATLSGSKQVSFSTNQSGVYDIELKIEDTNGNTWSVVERIRAGERDLPMPEGIRTGSAPGTGVYALVGDGFSGGDVQVSQNGQQVTVVGVIAQDADAPEEVHVYTSGLSLGGGTDTTVRVLRGESRQTVQKQIPLVVHGPSIPDGSTVYQAGNQPITREGTAHGVLSDGKEGTNIETLLGADGSTTISVNTNPGLLEQALWTLRTESPVNVPFVILSPLSGFGALAGGLLVVRRRRQSA